MTKRTELTGQDFLALQMVDAYWQVWVNWKTDQDLVKLAGPVRRGQTSVWRRINKLKESGHVETKGRPIMGGGVAFALTDLGRTALDNAIETGKLK